MDVSKVTTKNARELSLAEHRTKPHEHRSQRPETKTKAQDRVIIYNRTSLRNDASHRHTQKKEKTRLKSARPTTKIKKNPNTDIKARA